MESLQACTDLEIQTVTMSLKEVRVRPALEYDLSRNFRPGIETDSEEFTSASDLKCSSDDSDFIAYLQNVL